MCRHPICFRGMTSRVRQWTEQKQQEKMDKIFGEAFNYIIEEWEDESEWDEESVSEEETPFDSPRSFRESAPEPEPPSPTEDHSYFWNIDDNSSWTTGSIIEYDIMKILAIMQKNFNKLIYSGLSFTTMFSMVTNPNLKIATEYEYIMYDPYTISPEPKTIHRRMSKGISRKCRRRQGQIPGLTSSLIQLLAEQLFLVL